MSRAPKETVRERLQGLFGFKGKTGSSHSGAQVKKGEFFITPAIKKNLSRESPVNVRVKTINQLSTLVGEKKLEDNAVETLWMSISDLLDPQVSTDHRHLVLHFLKCIIIGQSEFLGPMRCHFFQVVKKHNIFEDLPQRLDMLRALSDNGKNLLDFEEETGPFLLLWMPDVISYGKTAEFLQVLVNVIKYNSCYLDDHVIAGLVQHTCSICSRTDTERDIEQSLHVLDAVICYSCLPSESLYYFITALCRTVSVKKFCQSSWKLMRNLLGTHLGHSAIYTMCCIMEDSHNTSDVVLLRGAVFFVGMARWGSMRVQSLRHNFTSVLPSFHRALNCKHVLVAYEVTLSLQRLVKKYGMDIQTVTWDIIISIIAELFKHIEEYAVSHEFLPTQLHDLLSMVESLHEKNVFNGSPAQLFAIVEEFAHLRPDSSVLCLVSYRAESIHPTKENWIPNLQGLLDRYFRGESRTVIREAALNVLASALVSSGTLYEDDLIKLVLLPQLKSICDDRDPVVRNCAVKLLADSAQVCQTPFCLDILDIIEKVVMKNMHLGSHGGGAAESEHKPNQAASVSKEERDLEDVLTAVTGLLAFFRIKLYRIPTTHAVSAFDLLVRHMKQQYAKKYNSEMASNIRAKVFECMLQLRADSLCRLGLPGEDGTYKYSPYILCDSRMEPDYAGKTSPPTCSSPTPGERHLKPVIIPFVQAFKTVTYCLMQETHWKVLSQVLPCLTQALQNKNLVLAANANMENLCVVLCSMVEDRSHISRLQNSAGFNRIDFHTGIYSCLTALVPYHSLFDQQKKVHLIKCFEAGLKLKCAQQCVDGLTLCVIEMQDTMLKVLPSIILVMSQMSATPTMAIPVLEFLSSLIWFPQLYANFVESQYMSIFAVALHYTNPFKFSLYVVSLAHHVIAMWFIKCRLPFRREFVNCITRGLQANALRGMLDFNASSNPPSVRLRRSSSLTEQSNKSEKGKTKAEEERSQKAKMEEAIDTLNKLLMETCLDMMARYTYSTPSTLPKRSPVSEFLLAGGQSQSWLVGNKIVTVTTSGGSTRLQRNGVCEKCNALIQQYVETTSTASTEKGNGESANNLPSTINQQEEKPGQEATKKQHQGSAGAVTTATSGFGRLKRQRSKSGNTQRVDSSGNALQQRVLRTEDQEEVKHLTLFSSVAPEVIATVGETSRGSSSESLKGTDGHPAIPRHKKVDSNGAKSTSKVSFVGVADKGQESKVTKGQSSKVTFADKGHGSLLEQKSSGSQRATGPAENVGAQGMETENTRRQGQDGSGAVNKKVGKVMFASEEPEKMDAGKVVAESGGGVGVGPGGGGGVARVTSDAGDQPSGFIKPSRPSSRVSSASFYQCNCWCQGWAEIHVRRPTGNSSWIMRIQNGGALLPSSQDFPLADISALLLRNRDLDLDLDMVLPDDEEDEEEEDEEEERSELLSSGDMENIEEEIGIQSGAGGGMPTDVESHSFPRPEMGLSPMSPSFLHDYASLTKKEHGDQQESEYMRVLRELTSEQVSMDPLAEGSGPGLRRSNSSPALITMGETSPAHSPGAEGALSPRTMARSFLEGAPQKPGSYSYPSQLEKKYRADAMTGSAVQTTASITTAQDAGGLQDGDKKTDSRGDNQPEPGVGVLQTREPGVSVLQTSGSSEFLDISYRDVISNEQKSAAGGPELFSAAPDLAVRRGSAPIDSRDGGAASRQWVPEKRKEEEERQLEKPQTLALGSHLTRREQQLLRPRRNLEHIHQSPRPRGHTVSIMVNRDRHGGRPQGSPASSRGRRPSDSKHRGSIIQRDSYRSGINPSFVFLQVYFSPMFTEGAERPVAIPISQVYQRAVKVLDRIPPHDTHKIGVLYVGQGQTNDETAILSNVYGSVRYMNFLRSLGQLVSLKGVNPDEVYTGGLDRTGSDGNYTYWWQDDIMQVIFHIATLMPNKESDPTCNSKKLHIGNDFVSIVYNESGQPYKLGTIKGQFNFAEIVVEPLDNDSNLVSVQAKPELEQMLGRRGPWMVSDDRVTLLVRQMALHANLASQIHRSSPQEAYCSNWLERLRQLHRIHNKVVDKGAPSNPMMDVVPSRYLHETPEKKPSAKSTRNSKISDFTDYA